jgi:hypothetical protein
MARILYTFDGFIALRKFEDDPINIERLSFHDHVGPFKVEEREWWDTKWAEFQAIQARIDERLYGLEATADDALGGHHEPVAL